MKLGVFTQPLHALGRPLAIVLREDREFILLADRLGYEEAFIGEHVTDAAEVITDSMTFIAWLLEETRTIKLGTGTLNLPNHHPARIAATAAMIDHLADGRFIMGISPGGLMSDVEAFGNLGADRNAMFVDCIDLILKIWGTEAPYDFEGSFWKVSTQKTFDGSIGQGIIHKPLQRPHPPIVVTAMSPRSPSVQLAAERGWSPLSAHFIPPSTVASHWPYYMEHALKAGHQPDRRNWRVAKSIFVADDMDTARRYATERSGPYYQYYHSLVSKLVGNGRASVFKKDPRDPDESVTTEYVLDQVVVWGTPDKVAEELAQFHDQLGGFGTLLYAGHDWVDENLARRSLELMAEEVLPAMTCQALEEAV